MRKLHIVTPYESIAMHKMTDPLSNLSGIFEITTGTQPNLEADLNYHVPWHTLAGLDKGNSKHAMLYTHCNPGAESALMDACERADLIICMSFSGRKDLVSMGVDPAKLWVIYAGADGQMVRKNIGVIGFEQPNARKRLHLLLDLVWKLDKNTLSAINFVLVGGGMEQIGEEMKSAGASVVIEPPLSKEDLESLYPALDLLLVTGYTEGGPLPILEAFASGVDVLSPDFGYGADFLPDRSIYKSDEDLINKLTARYKSMVDNVLLAKALSWQQYVNEHVMAFVNILGGSEEWENGSRRYDQLLDIIRNEEIQTICEIGTWNGARAVQMIQAAAHFNPIENVEYYGFDLFEAQTGEQLRREFSKPGWPQEIVARRISATGCKISLIGGDTHKTLLPNIKAGMDLYFIDGGHSEATIRHDWKVVAKAMTKNSTVVFDDYYGEGKPEGVGCNVIIDNLDRRDYEVTILPVVTDANGLHIQMAEVRLARIPV